MLCIIVEKIDESPAGTYSMKNGYRIDNRGGILCFKVPDSFEEIDVCTFMFKNKNRFAKIGGCYRSVGDLIKESTSPEDLLDKIESSQIDGDSESLVQFFWCHTDNVPVLDSDYLLRLEYCEDEHTDISVIHHDDYDEDEEDEDEWKNDSGVYIRKLSPEYVFELSEDDKWVEGGQYEPEYEPFDKIVEKIKQNVLKCSSLRLNKGALVDLFLSEYIKTPTQEQIDILWENAQSWGRCLKN